MTSRDEISRRLHPRLRCLRNGAATVNLLRSDISSTVATAPSVSAESVGVPLSLDLSLIRETFAISPAQKPVQTRTRLTKRPKLAEQRLAEGSFVNVLVELYRDRSANGASAERSAVERIKAIAQRGQQNATDADKSSFGSDVLVRRNFVSATIPIASLVELEQDPDIAFVHPSEPLSLDQPMVRADFKTAPQPRSVHSEDLPKAHRDGEDVIIGIIDVGGFDFAHPDFRDPKDGTRFISIWDQGGDFRDPPSSRGDSRFDYGSELTKPLMDAAIMGEKAGKFPATFTERQSQRSEGSHATHVASIAAGNKGVCPNAMIAAVLVSIPTLADRTEERRATFSDSMRIATRENKPISINISLGTNGGAHDGSSGVSRWIDALLATPGRAVCVAARNAGQEKAQSSEDIGFVMGRIHSSGRIASRGLSVDIEWTVVGNGVEDMSENEMEIWYGAQDRLTVMLKPPGRDSQWITVRSREYV